MNFRVQYDDTQMDVVERISSALAPFGLTITEGEGGDGWIDYEIKEIAHGSNQGG